MCAQHEHSGGCCTASQPAGQTLDELAFERGLWGAARQSCSSAMHGPASFDRIRIPSQRLARIGIRTDILNFKTLDLF
jgi:hypothetical protein